MEVICNFCGGQYSPNEIKTECSICGKEFLVSCEEKVIYKTKKIVEVVK